MIQHDYRCSKCSTTYEIAWNTFEDFRKEVDCACGGTAIQVWRKAPGLAGVEEPSTRGVRRTFHAGLDVQTGKYFQSRVERERYIRSRGLEIIGPEEHKRMLTQITPDPEPEMAGLKDAMEKSWQELHAGKPAPPMGQIDLGKDIVMGGGK